MTSDSNPIAEQAPDETAYLVVRSGSKQGQIYRLMPGVVITLGRATTNRIVVDDEICSRHHCEVYLTGGRWMLRDLDSRNGTRVDGVLLEKDWELRPGQTVIIGSTQLGFCHDLKSCFNDDGSVRQKEEDTAVDLKVTSDLLTEQPPEILHRRRESRFQTPDIVAAEPGRDRVNRELARLYKLAMEMGKATTSQSLAEIVLSGLLESTPSDIGAVLLLPNCVTPPADPAQLSLVAYRSKHEMTYQRVSDYLTRIVLTEHDAILARDVSDDAELSERDSLGELKAASLLCAPIRIGPLLYGLIHLYSTDVNNPLATDDLEFALALADQFGICLQNLTQLEHLQVGLARAETENQTLRQQLQLETDLIGDSAALQHLRSQLVRIAPTDATVLIRGESGVGKELVARALHNHSSRKNGPFVTMNCAALSESLLESELFGHEKGAFTGAVTRKIGKFEQAHQGTLFLDEVGEMSPGVQAKFLRVLEGHPFERVGGAIQIQVDVRVLAATNRDLEEAVEEGSFRKDLYFRLQVVELLIAPLRERKADLPVLARYFMQRALRKTTRNIQGFTPAALEAIMAYDWPGNVRELQNTIERSVILCTSDRLDRDDIQLSSLNQLSSLKGTSDAIPVLTTALAAADFQALPLEVVEQQHILATLEWTNWNKSQAAQILGIERSTLDRKLKRYDVERPR